MKTNLLYNYGDNMNTTIKFSALILVIIGLSSCGKMGELEPVKAEVVAMKISTVAQADIV